MRYIGKDEDCYMECEWHSRCAAKECIGPNLVALPGRDLFAGGQGEAGAVDTGTAAILENALYLVSG